MKNKNWWKKFSVWEWFAMVATCVLVVAIVCTAIVIANKKHDLDELNQKNEEITQNNNFHNFDDNFLNIYVNDI